MKNNQINILDTARSVILQESEAIATVAQLLDQNLEAVVSAIHNSQGRVVISGIGKSAIIAQKIAATMNSTGTAALFMHAADAIHGDLGMLREQDIAIVISKSGESAEIRALLPLIRNFGNTVVAICGNKQSYLATNAHFLLDTTVSHEACPNNLAPTSSTTAQMVMGDALAVCLLRLKGFSPHDFARYHPGGALGKRLYLKVKDLMAQNALPAVPPEATLEEIIIEISSKRLGATAVITQDAQLLGIITDGDLRRMLQSGGDHGNMTAAQLMTQDPKSIDTDELAVEALAAMRAAGITQLPAISNGRYAGMVHLHDLLREGII